MRALSVVVSGLLLSLAGFGVHSPAQADQVNDVLVTEHEVEVYPQSVPAHTGSMSGLKVRVTRDGVETVERFYSSHEQGEDKLEAYQEGAATGSQLVHHAWFQGKDHPSVLVTMASVQTKDPHPVFTALLKPQVTSGLHTQAEYDRLLMQYPDLAGACYREVRGEDGKAGDEGDLIYRKYSRLANPDAEKIAAHGEDAEVTSRAEAQAEALQKRMLDLKAKGDIAGMMALSGQAQDIQAEAAGVSGKELMPGAKDTWDIWVKCLKELNAAAYWTKITYEPGTLSE